MPERLSAPADRVLPTGTQVVALVDIQGQGGRTLHPYGSVAVIVRSPQNTQQLYRVRFPDGVEELLHQDQLVILAKHETGEIGKMLPAQSDSLYQRVILRCVIGSRAYGLDDENSDTDYRGIYLPPAELQWSLYGVPEQLECHDTQETYWELQKFLVLALKANPNVLECLYTPLVEKATPLAEELLAMRSCFLSRLVYQTVNGYVISQFKKMQAAIRNQGRVKWKHVMHLIRLLISGARTLREGSVPVCVEQHRQKLLAIKHGQVPWEDTEQWRLCLHQEFEEAFRGTTLPERPDYERANAFLVNARRAASQEGLP